MENRNFARGTLKQPESNKKTIVIIAVASLIALSASGGLYYMFYKSADTDVSRRPGEFGPPRMREWNDNNMPNPQKQTAPQIMAYMDSDKFKKLSAREQFMYMGQGGQKVMEYQMDTYFSLPDEKQKTAYLDKVIDRMQAQQANFEKMRNQMPRRDANEPNDPNRPQFARRFSASNMRERSEMGTPSERAKRTAFFQAMRQRMQQRGINNQGRRGGFGGFGGRPR